MNVGDYFAVFIVLYVGISVYFLSKDGNFGKSVRLDELKQQSREVPAWILWETTYTNKYFFLYLLFSLYLSVVFLSYPFGWVLSVSLFSVFLYRFYKWYRDVWEVKL